VFVKKTITSTRFVILICFGVLDVGWRRAANFEGSLAGRVIWSVA
jgi:hypothetical protein